LLNPGTVPEGQYGQRGEIDATFDPTRNRIVTLDQAGRIWVYEFLPSGVRMRALNGGARVVGGRRNCAVAYVPGLDAVVQTGCAPQYALPGQLNGLPVFTFPDNDTVAVYFQCDAALCGAPAVANFLAWHPGLNQLVGAGGWSYSFSRNKVNKYVLGSPPVLPSFNTPWTYLPQSGAAPNYSCDICLEGMRRTVLRLGKMVYVDPLTYNLYTYDFAPPPGQPTWTVTNTNKPAPIPANAVIGYDEVQDKLIAWVGVDALYWYSGAPTVAQTWIYDFASNTWIAGPSKANGDTTPFATVAGIPIFVWDSVAQRLLMITNDAVATGYTRIWALTWQ
jgi:hypothetical protein